MERKISLIIPTMNRFESLQKTLDSFLSGKIVPDEIIIVDQSNHKTSMLIKSFAESKPNITYIYQSEASLTKARNNGLLHASNDIVVFSDDDVNVFEDTIYNIGEIMKDDSISMIAGYNSLENKSTSLLGYFLGYKSFFKKNIGHVAPAIFGRFPNRIKEETKTMWAMGFFFVVRKSLLDKWQLSFDEKLKSYAYPEDLDFSYAYYRKSRAEGYRCVLSNRVVVEHLTSQEYRVPSRKSTFMFVLHRAYIYKKFNLSYFRWVMFKIANYAFLLKLKIKKENTKDLKEAMRYLKKNKKTVFEGRFYYGD